MKERRMRPEQPLSLLHSFTFPPQRGARRAALVLALGVSLFALTGCFRSEADLQRENVRLREQLADCNDRLAAQESMLTDLRSQLETARALTDADRAALIAPKKLLLGRLTGGEDYDGRPGDDGVTAHFQLLDEVGDPIKVAGDVTIELFDLSSGGAPRRIGNCRYPAAEVRKKWVSTLLTYMFAIECPFEQPPQGSEITVRVTFLDYLTRNSLTAQTTVRLNEAG